MSIDYESMSVSQLRDLIRSRGCRRTEIASARKSQLVLIASGMDPDAVFSVAAEAKAEIEAEQAPPRDAVADYLAGALSGRIKAGLDVDAVRDVVRDELEKQCKPTRVEIHNAATGVTTQVEGIHHFRFPTLLELCQCRDKDGRVPNIYLYGPAGTGKTTAAANAAKELKLPFHYNGAIDSEYKLSGFVDAGGTYHHRPFYEAFRDGGVYLFDELDSSLPGALLAFNAALANGHADFPTGRVERHRDCIIIAAGNTTLRGDGNADGFQRYEQDGALRDRFPVMVDWPIDLALEAACVPAVHRGWLDVVRTVRDNVQKHGIKKSAVTPRTTFAGMALLDRGLPMSDVINFTLRRGLTDESWKKAKEGI